MNDWKEVPGWEGYYEMDSLFRIRGMKRYRGRVGIMRQKIDSSGYPSVKLTREGKTQGIRIHRLIGKMFVPNPENKPFINHKDGNKANNSLDNLEWVTAGENLIHSYQSGLRKAPIGKRYAKQYKSIVCLDLNENELAIFKSSSIAAKLLKVNRPTISKVLRGEIESAYGFIFKYADK